MMRYFVENKIGKGGHFTISFQEYVEGETLTNKGEEKKELPNLGSYQKAFLLGMILGNMDARGDNVILDPNGELVEIDNEYIGGDGYWSLGVLNDFSQLKLCRYQTTY